MLHVLRLFDAPGNDLPLARLTNFWDNRILAPSSYVSPSSDLYRMGFPI
jgi:hypothetical protein